MFIRDLKELYVNSIWIRDGAVCVLAPIIRALCASKLVLHFNLPRGIVIGEGIKREKKYRKRPFYRHNVNENATCVRGRENWN